MADQLDPVTLLEAGREAARRLAASGRMAYFVGGCVRDRLLGLPVKDLDIATDARPQEVAALFPGTQLVGASFGVCIAPVGPHRIEIATFRAEGDYQDHRHPGFVRYGTLAEDVRRRDFTVNALYEDPATGAIVDLVDGRADLDARVLRCVGDPDTRFHEDALRLLRAVRFAARFGFRIERRTFDALCQLGDLAMHLSAERIRDELTAMWTGPDPAGALLLLSRTGLLDIILPEVAAMRGVEQGREFHPEGDVFEHTMLVMAKLEPRTTRAAWGALLHDVGKPPTFARDAAGRITFREHERIGAELAREVLERFRLPSSDIDHICSVVARHMTFSMLQHMRPATLRRFLAAPTIEDDLAVHRADCLGSNGRLDYWEFARETMASLGEGAARALPKPFVGGDDLLALGVPPGPALGRALRELHDRQLDGEFPDREAALAAARALVSGAGAGGASGASAP
ncbi:MAG: CCA tRNA nucleotidyltransferase [Candidatus Sumerlaeia bacterium]|nr:CCA tRNA nucleotidyltransferase [Candidatus Sumerlaeia bacterium]